MNMRMVAYSCAALMFVVPLLRGDVSHGSDTAEAVFVESDFDAEGHVSQPLTAHTNGKSEKEGSDAVTTRYSVAVKVKDSKSGRVMFADTVIVRAKSLAVPPGQKTTINVTVDRSRQGGREIFTSGIEVMTEKSK